LEWITNNETEKTDSNMRINGFTVDSENSDDEDIRKEIWKEMDKYLSE